MAQGNTDTSEKSILMANAAGSSSVVLVCEHASHHIPNSFNALGLSKDDRKSHAVWDIGALALAQQMSKRLDAVLIASNISRLVYDCNRPPTSPDAMPPRSELIDVPGNVNLSQSERDARVDTYYRPFQAALESLMQQVSNPVLVTIHSFTPVYNGQPRSVEIGVLHDSDTRLADVLLQTAPAHLTANVQRNQPYGPEHGVTHTLKVHAIEDGHLNVMLEIRNDLIKTPDQQVKMANTLSEWIAASLTKLSVHGDIQCRA